MTDPDAGLVREAAAMLEAFGYSVKAAHLRSLADRIDGAGQPDVAGWPRIWCDNCKATQPMNPSYMPADGKNDHAALDLLCGECSYIVATLHEASGRREHPAQSTACDDEGCPHYGTLHGHPHAKKQGRPVEARGPSGEALLEHFISCEDCMNCLFESNPGLYDAVDREVRRRTNEG